MGLSANAVNPSWKLRQNIPVFDGRENPIHRVSPGDAALAVPRGSASGAGWAETSPLASITAHELRGGCASSPQPATGGFDRALAEVEIAGDDLVGRPRQVSLHAHAA
jgi:hypothetical protein